MIKKSIPTALLALLLAAPGAMALGSDITVWDGNTAVNPSAGWLYDPGPVHREDNETEPGTAPTDAWDLEGFFFDNSTSMPTLNMVGSFNFLGFAGNVTRRDAMAGDLFISAGAIANGNQFEALLGGNGGWYLDMDWANASGDNTGGSVGYTLHAFTGGEYTGNQLAVPNGTIYDGSMSGFVRAAVVDQSGPWRGENVGNLVGGGSAVLSQTPGVAGRLTLGDGSLGMHNVVAFDWAMLAGQMGLANLDAFSLHMIMSCGNDALYGSMLDGKPTPPLTPPVPEPASLLLLGLGLSGALLRKRFIA